MLKLNKTLSSAEGKLFERKKGGVNKVVTPRYDRPNKKRINPHCWTLKIGGTCPKNIAHSPLRAYIFLMQLFFLNQPSYEDVSLNQIVSSEIVLR